MTMKILDILRRNTMPEPWLEGERIPWDDADFSQRMLKEHLSQDHDLASRRFSVIERQVQWIHRRILLRKPVKILDLGCGPGLYTSRLAKLGHRCTGIDFAPASIEYAQKQAEREEEDCSYVSDDVRNADFGGGYGLVMMVFGALNVFKLPEAKEILKKARGALETDGHLLLEVHLLEALRGDGERQTYWYSEESGLFSEKPHLLLGERFWDESNSTVIERYYIIGAAGGEVKQYSAGMQAYSEEQYAELLEGCGFRRMEFYESMGGSIDGSGGEFFVIAAQR
ncbi:MAG: methyltransferase domain-containing protein [FCB group bacterium]|nr:methyltransferase domain-containing protein [FCB group bacterium]